MENKSTEFVSRKRKERERKARCLEPCGQIRTKTKVGSILGRENLCGFVPVVCSGCLFAYYEAQLLLFLAPAERPEWLLTSPKPSEILHAWTRFKRPSFALHTCQLQCNFPAWAAGYSTIQYSIRAGVYHPHDNTYKVLYHTIEIGDCRRLMHSMGLRIFCGQ